MMTLWQFETALRTLQVLDMQELVDAGAIADRDYAAWDAFHADRVKWFLEHPASDAVFRAIWRHRTPSSEIEAEAPPDNVVDLRIGEHEVSGVGANGARHGHGHPHRHHSGWTTGPR